MNPESEVESCIDSNNRFRRQGVIFRPLNLIYPSKLVHCGLYVPSLLKIAK